jgi:hypothetical protein
MRDPRLKSEEMLSSGFQPETIPVLLKASEQYKPLSLAWLSQMVWLNWFAEMENPLLPPLSNGGGDSGRRSRSDDRHRAGWRGLRKV